MSKVMLVMAPSFGHKSVLVEVLRVISLLPLNKSRFKICFSSSTLKARGGVAGVKGGAVDDLLRCVCACGCSTRVDINHGDTVGENVMRICARGE